MDIDMDKKEVKHVCKVCGRGFKSVRALCGHQRCHSSSKIGRKDGNKLLCNKCGKGFKSFKALDGHMRLHSGRKSGRCSLKKKKRSVRKYKINTCSFNYAFRSSFNNFGDDEELREIASCLLLLANVSVGSETVTRRCRDDVVLSGGDNGDGGDKFTGFNSDVCKIGEENGECGSAFVAENVSEMDVNEIPEKGLIVDGGLGSIENRLEESKCEITGVNLDTSGPTPGNYSTWKHICKTCNKGFRYANALKGHRMNCPSSKKFICFVCSKEFSCGQALGGHMRAHFHGNTRSGEKKNDAFDCEFPGDAEGEISLQHIPNPHTLPVLLPVV